MIVVSSNKGVFIIVKLDEIKLYCKVGQIIKAKVLIRSKKGKVIQNVIVPGLRVKVVPLNPNKKKNRDRIGTVTGFTEQYDIVRAKVQFDDTKGIGKIEMEELVIIKE